MMLSKFQKSVFFKPTTILLVVAFMSMSFSLGGNGQVVLNAGTHIVLETTSMIRSDMVQVGNTLDFRVKHDVKVDGVTVIRAGSIAKGQVMRAQAAKGIGKEGFVEIQIKSVNAVDGQQVYLSGGNIFQEGEDKQTLSILLGVFVCILFLTMKGENAQVPAGYEIDATVASTLNIEV